MASVSGCRLLWFLHLLVHFLWSRLGRSHAVLAILLEDWSGTRVRSLDSIRARGVVRGSRRHRRTDGAAGR